MNKFMNKVCGSLIALLLACECVCASSEGEITISQEIQEVYATHEIGLESVRNARHLGGYVGADGKETRVVGALRSANISELSGEDAAVLKNECQLTDEEITTLRDKYLE